MSNRFWICRNCGNENAGFKGSCAECKKLGETQSSAIDLINIPDLINHPPHYGKHPSRVECIEITEHMNFCLGNAMKYLWRASLKNGKEDLKKAIWYINREIDRMEKFE